MKIPYAFWSVRIKAGAARNGGFALSKIYIVGIGPGNYEEMTIRAVKALQQCEVIIGYQVYIGLVEPYFPGKEFLSTPMAREEERCRLSFETALAGKDTALVCSGDAGIYGMAGLFLEIGQEYPDAGIEVEIVPGITAASSGAALLGAPLMQDFFVISLSDLLTPWEKIEKRLHAAAASDTVLCLYNPSSRKRKDHLRRACEIVLQYASPDTVCGIAERTGREGERIQICRLSELKDTPVNMFTTVFIGNSETKEIDGSMVTPRGYRIGDGGNG